MYFLQEQLIDEANRNPSKKTLDATLTLKSEKHKFKNE